MKALKSIRENCSHRLNLVYIFWNCKVCLRRLEDTKDTIVYIESDENNANAYKIGSHIIDCSNLLNYRIFKAVEAKRKRKGKQVYSVKLDNEILPGKQKRGMIRLYTAIDDEYSITAILRYYEIVYIIHTLRKHTGNSEFWNWIYCEDKKMQVNHITGEYENSGNVTTLEICTQEENLFHGSILNYFRKQTANSVGSLFMATAKECCLAKERLMNIRGTAKVSTAEVYALLVAENKILTSL